MPPPASAAVLTVSDAGARADESGDLVLARLEAMSAELIRRAVVPDDPPAIRDEVLAATAEADLLVTTGGTGLGPRDVTPQTVAPLLD